MDDSTSIRKKSVEEEKVDEELAKAVNRTLAEEEKKKEEDERKKRDEKKKTTNGVKDHKEKRTDIEEQMGQGEDCPSANLTCPEVKPCPEFEPCPEIKPCPPCEECGSCPEVDPCQPCGPCPPIHCQPCPVVNRTNLSVPDGCPEAGGMTIPVAMAVGAIASLLVTGVATAIGLLLRYTSPIFSGLLFIFIVVLTWYRSSHYPETARELGGRVVATLREATMALSHRVLEAIRHHDQVGSPIFLSILLSTLSSIFHLKSLH